MPSCIEMLGTNSKLMPNSFACSGGKNERQLLDISEHEDEDDWE